jgi:glycosyltransferase involved in cell wall biosynthesis
LFHIPDAQTGWRARALHAGREMLSREGPFDLIYASAPPFSGLMIAARLASESRVPWIAELRDLWTDNHDYRYAGIRRAIDLAIERRVLASASAFVTVSEPLARIVRRRFAQPVEVVLNGHDLEDVPPIPAPAAGSRLEIVYTGSVYAAYDFDTLARALAQLGEERRAIRFSFYGRNLDVLHQKVRKAGLAQSFRFSPTVPRVEALALQRKADILLFFGWQGASKAGVLTSKLFEYLGARRPILAISEADSDAGRVIAEADSGLVSVDPSAIAEWLRGHLRGLRDRGRAPDLPMEHIEQHSRRQRAIGLDRFMRLVVSRAA